MKLMIISLLLTIVFAVPVAYADTWSLLDSPEILDGTAVTYYICDSLMVDEYTGVVGGCYTATLNFHDVLYTDFAAYLIVSVQTEIGEDVRNEIFLIDTRTFEIKNIDKRSQISDSLSRTLFWIGKISNDILLEEGALVSNMKSYFPEDIPLMVQKKITKGDSVQYVLGYRLFKDSTITITPGIQFPLSAEIHSITNVYPEPTKIFEFNYVNRHATTNDFSFEPVNDFSNSYINENFTNENFTNENIIDDISNDIQFDATEITQFSNIESDTEIENIVEIPENIPSIISEIISPSTSTSPFPEIRNNHYGK